MSRSRNPDGHILAMPNSQQLSGFNVGELFFFLMSEAVLLFFASHFFRLIWQMQLTRLLNYTPLILSNMLPLRLRV